MRALTCVVIGATCALGGCKKKDDAPTSSAKPGTKSEQGGPKDVPVGDPWAADSHSSKLAASTGTQLSKIDTTKDPAPANTLAAKVDLASIAQPTEPKLAIRGFASNAKVTGFEVTYNPSKNPVHEQFRSALQSNHVFEAVAEGLNKTVR